MNLCLICKGVRKLCGKEKCPLLTKIYYQKISAPKIKENLFGPSPKSVFVGHEGYPDLFVGPMVSLDESNLERLDTPEKMYGMNLESIVKDRYSLVRGKLKRNVFIKDRYIQELQDIALSVKPVDIEINFSKKPSFSQSFSTITQPMGASGEVNKIKVVDNPKITKKVYHIINGGIKANDAAIEFYNSKFEVSQISKILSSGVLGVKKKIVPTRWSITAMDDLLGKHFIKQIKDFDSVNEYFLFMNSYLDNYYYIILIPGNWEFEQFESWFPGTLWNLQGKEPSVTVEHEGYTGRNKYAISQSGGYYAARFAVAEGLLNMKKQARAMVIREIYEGYEIPVGVWEVREGIRNALKLKPDKFTNLNELFNFLNTKLRLPVEEYNKKSKLLTQRRLNDFC